MALVDDRGRILGRFNLIDLAIAILVLGLIPLAYGGYLLFRTPKPTITSIEPPTIQHDGVMRLRINGTNLRPYMRVSLNNNQARQFLFRDTTSAEVTFSEVPPGTYDVVLYDVAQEQSRLSKGLTITPPALPVTQVHVAGFLTGVTDPVLKALQPGYNFFGFAQLLAVGRTSSDQARVVAGDLPVAIPVANTLKVALNLKIPCSVLTLDNGVAQCRAGSADSPGVNLGPALAPGIYIKLPILDVWLPFYISQVRPPIAPTPVSVTLKIPPYEVGGARARTGDTDAAMADNEFVAGGVIASAMNSIREVTLTLPAFPAAQGWEYNGQILRVGAQFRFVTAGYQLAGVLADVPPLPAQPR